MRFFDLDDSWRSFWQQFPLILRISEWFSGKYLLVCEENSAKHVTARKGLHLSAFFQSWGLHFVGKALSFGEFVRIQFEIISDQSLHSWTAYFVLLSQFSDASFRISAKFVFDGLSEGRGPRSSCWSSSRTIFNPSSLFETLYDAMYLLPMQFERLWNLGNWRPLFVHSDYCWTILKRYHLYLETENKTGHNRSKKYGKNE